MIKLFDFYKRAPIPMTKAAAPTPETQLEMVTEESLVERGWTFVPIIERDGTQVFSHADAQVAAAIYSAQQMRRVADDVELIRKHITRLQLVAPKDGDGI